MVDKRPHYVGVSSLSVFGGNFILARVRLAQCLLFRVERCLLLGGSKYISSTVKSIRGK